MRSIAYVMATLVALVGLPVVGAAADESGPAKGQSLMLDVKPFNKTGDAYCAVCSTAPNPLVMAFVTKNDDATHLLLNKLEEAYHADQDKHLHAVIVLVGAGPEIDGLKAYITDQKLTTPAAVVAPDDDDLKTWKLNLNVENTVVFIKQHKVESTSVALAADDLPREIGTLLG